MLSKTLIPFLFLLFIPAPALAVSDAYQRLSVDLVVRAEDDISAERNAEANALLDLALVADPGNARAFVLKGQVQHLLGDSDEGLRLVSIGLQIDPVMLEGLVLQARLASELGNVIVAEAALERFRRICKTNCAEADTLGALVETARNADDTDPATDSASAKIDGE